jgi:hypothetical protein
MMQKSAVIHVAAARGVDEGARLESGLVKRVTLSIANVTPGRAVGDDKNLRARVTERSGLSGKIIAPTEISRKTAGDNADLTGGNHGL